MSATISSTGEMGTGESVVMEISKVRKKRLYYGAY
jgi:hypothetical protein